MTSVTVFHHRCATHSHYRYASGGAPVPDFERLRHADRVVRRIRGGQLSLDDAIAEIAVVEQEPSKYRLRVIYFGWAMLASSVTVLLGSGIFVAATAALITLAIVVIIGELAARELPTFFQNAVGGTTATLAAALLYA